MIRNLTQQSRKIKTSANGGCFDFGERVTGIAYNSRHLPAARSQAAPRGTPRQLLVVHRCGLQSPARTKQLIRFTRNIKTRPLKRGLVLLMSG